MSFTGRSTGRISIPIEIIPSSKSSKINPPIPILRTNYSSSDFACLPPRTNLSSKISITNNNREPSDFYSSRSNDDFLSSSTLNPNRSNTLSQKTSRRYESDFIHPHKPIHSLQRSVDLLNDFSDYHVPTNCHHQAHDRSHSPASQRDESPTRPPRPQGTSPQQESDFQTSKDATQPSNDQQVPSPELPPRDPNIIALEKLEHIKQNLADLHEQVDAFSGSTRDDRAYKQLDEHAVKLMLRCDELTDVSVEIKEKRKEMIQHVQLVVAKLESKVPNNLSMDANSNQDDTTSLEQST